MTTRRHFVAVLFAALVAAPVLPALRAHVDTLPSELSNEEFWRLSQEFSEPSGFFRSDNLLSNERWLQWVIPDLVQRVGSGGVYLGVGPEQNFTYIAAIRPRMAFITDIRRGNLHTHLMYKALFELSADRAEFISRLFTKPRPDGVGPKSTGLELINAFWDVPTGGEPAYRENLKAIQDHLTRTRKIPLSVEDLGGIEYVYYNFYWFGPSITYNSSSGGRGGSMSTYGDLQVATDGAGVARGFLASEENFRVLKDLSARNLIVPVVGNFAGPKALRAVGEYVRSRGATVSAFYLSNVEQYLNQDGIWRHFCANVASMPLDERSTFIRSSQGGGGPGGGLVNTLGGMAAETRGCGPVSPPRGVRMR